MEDQLAKLERENCALRHSLGLVLTTLNLILLAGCFYRCWTIPKYKEVLAGLGEGRPLPMVTTIMFDNVKMILAGCLALCAAGIVSAFTIRGPRAATASGIVTALLLLACFLLLNWATFAPLVELMNGLAGDQ